MVLRPILDSEPPISTDFTPAWSAVETQQTLSASSWWLITQPDHAALSGRIAAHFHEPGFPTLPPDIVEAIAMHDAGWNLFESDPRKAPRLGRDGRPLSFIEIEPESFLRAWTASIDRAQENSAAGAYMVSQHFSHLGESRLQRAEDPVQLQALIRGFLADEQSRRTELVRSAPDLASWNALLPALQFCDLLSLYLCCGSRQPVEFPQEFAGGRVRARYDDETCVLDPSPFATSWQARIDAVHHPDHIATRLSIPLK